MFGPVTGEALAQHILFGKSDIPIDMLHYRRFAEGKLLIEPAVV
jgi:sarcosine oxidase subunit beta